jgi:hypothetical protein
MLMVRNSILVRKSALSLVTMGLLGWACWGHGIPTASLRWSLAAIGLALALPAVAEDTQWKSAVRWTAVAFIGQACSLQLIEAGNVVRLQLFYGWGDVLRSFRLLFLLIIVLQGLVVLWGIRRTWPNLAQSLRTSFGWRQIAIFAGALSFAAVTVSPSLVQSLVNGGLAGKLAIYGSKLALGLWILVINALNLSLAAHSIPAGLWQLIVARWERADRRRLPLWCALWVVVASSLLAWIVFSRMPHIPDEVAYLFQAKYIAGGHLSLPSPPDPPAFYYPFQIVNGEKWYNGMPIGWPVFLALGVKLGVPWLVNPVLGGLAILLAYALISRVYDRKVAEGVALLLAASPWLIYLSASLMPHSVSLVLSLLAFLSVYFARSRGSIGWAVIAGLSCGSLLHIRPLEAVIVAATAAVWWLGVGWARLRLVPLGVAALAGLALTALLLAYNHAMTGDALRMPVNICMELGSYPGANRLGFGRDIGNLGWTNLDPLPGHGPIDVLVNSNQNAYMLNFETFGWSCGSMLFVFVLLAEAHWRRDALMWGILFSVWAGTSLYWFSGGPDFGARYWYLMIVPLAALTVRGAQELATRWRVPDSSQPPGITSQRVWAFVGLASFLGCISLIPWRAIDKYRNYRGVSAEVRNLARENHFGKSLVFVRGEPSRLPWSSSPFYSAFVLNPARFDRDAPATIYVRDLGSESRARIQSYYSDRAVWILDGPSLTGSGFRVVEGPLPPQAASRPANRP